MAVVTQVSPVSIVFCIVLIFLLAVKMMSPSDSRYDGCTRLLGGDVYCP